MSESRARLAGAAAAFVILFAGALVAGHQASWFPSAPVYRFPKWTPLDLGMIDEEIARVGARADGGRWAILIGDSIPHGDGFGRPSESLGARLNEGIPTANLTSPSLAYVPALSLLRHSLGTDAPVIIVHINLKWVSHGWVPEKFTTLMNQIGDAGSDTTARERMFGKNKPSWSWAPAAGYHVFTLAVVAFGWLLFFYDVPTVGRILSQTPRILW